VLKDAGVPLGQAYCITAKFLGAIACDSIEETAAPTGAECVAPTDAEASQKSTAMGVCDKCGGDIKAGGCICIAGKESAHEACGNESCECTCGDAPENINNTCCPGGPEDFLALMRSLSAAGIKIELSDLEIKIGKLSIEE
jgi:hypothetical protein